MRDVLVWLVSSLLLTSACGQSPKLVAPSGDQAGYAERYPNRLQGVRSAFARDETSAAQDVNAFAGYPDALREPAFGRVAAVYELADADGRSSAYAETSMEGESVARFFEEEKDPLRQKVGGAVSYTAKQKNCSEDLGGAAVGAMERGVSKQLEERLRSRGSAHRSIEDYQDELGKGNVETLNKQADAIARASHSVHVRLELHRRELTELLDDASAVRSTLDRSVRENDAVLADPNQSKARQAIASRRRAAAEAAQVSLEAEAEPARRALAEMEARIEASEKQYRAAYDALLDETRARASKQEKR